MLCFDKSTDDPTDQNGELSMNLSCYNKAISVDFTLKAMTGWRNRLVMKAPSVSCVCHVCVCLLSSTFCPIGYMHIT